MEIIKVYDSQNYLNNVLIPLSLKVDKVLFITHEDIKLSLKEALINLLHKYDIKVKFYKLIDDKKEIDELFKNYPKAFISMSSNRYLSYYLFEKAIKDKREIIYYDYHENIIKSYNRHETLSDKVFNLNIKELIELAGGKLQISMHLAPDIDDEDLIDKIELIMNKAINNYSSFTTFISKTMQVLKGKDKTTLTISAYNSLKSSPYLKLFSDLNIIKINDLYMTIDKRFKLLLTNAGSWLESYLYIKLKKSHHFDDCVMSATIDFSGNDYRYPVVCEIDMITIKNNRLAFVSCKSNKVDSYALNEIKVHNVMFGNELSKSVIFTADDLNINNPPIFEKAKELDVAIIDKTAIINNAVALVMEKILDGSYSYEKIRR